MLQDADAIPSDCRDLMLDEQPVPLRGAT
jgi:hypothetical protein